MGRYGDVKGPHEKPPNSTRPTARPTARPTPERPPPARPTARAHELVRLNFVISLNNQSVSSQFNQLRYSLLAF